MEPWRGPPCQRGVALRAGGIPPLGWNPSTASGGPPPFYKGGFGGRAAVGAAFGRPWGKPPCQRGGPQGRGDSAAETESLHRLRRSPSLLQGRLWGRAALRQNAEGPRFRRKTGRPILTFQPVFGAFRPVFKAFGDFLGHSARYNAPCIGRKS